MAAPPARLSHATVRTRAQREHRIGAGHAESKKRRAGHDQREDWSGSLRDGLARPGMKDAIAEAEQEHCAGGDKQQIADEGLQQGAPEVSAERIPTRPER
jgi:hypothetical protein